MKSQGSFLEHYKKVRVEGFELHKLLTECIRAGIILREIHIENDLEMTMNIMDIDYDKFMRLVRNRYGVIVLHEKGYKPIYKKITGSKSTVVGLLVFILMMYYQSSFVSEIRVLGYEPYTEARVRETLQEAGLYEGVSKKSVDGNALKLYLYQNLDNIAWIGLKYSGNMAEVTIVEGTQPQQPADHGKPGHVVADKEGYVERIIAKEGIPAVEKGTYVKKGDVLISGIIPLKSTAYGTPESELTERYVHASGEVFAKVPSRLYYYQDRYDLMKEATSKELYGIRIELGDLKLNTAKMFNNFDSANYREKKLIKTIRPIPINISIVKLEEVSLSRKEKAEEVLEKQVNALVRSQIKETLAENVQILNKSLKFEPRENIIEASVMLETLEQIGIEKEILIGKPTE